MRRVSLSNKLRTLLGAKIGRLNIYTQKELAEILGVSTRTLRRFKNVEGYQLSKRTVNRIKAPLDKENRSFRRFIQGKAYDPKTNKLVKSPRFKLPNLPTQPIPTLYKSKSGLSQTLAIDCQLWATQEKIDYLLSAARSGRFSAWAARVRVPVGVSKSGDVDDTDVNDGEAPIHYMIGPFTLLPGHRTEKLIEREISYHEDAGRKVVNISIVENLKAIE
jgi:hypothetical protein